MLPTILEGRVALSVGYARDGEAIRNGHVFVAPRDRHLLIEDGRVSVTHGPRENGFRPRSIRSSEPRRGNTGRGSPASSSRAASTTARTGSRS